MRVERRVTGRSGQGKRLFAFSPCGYDKEVCYKHVTLLALIMLLACAALIGGDLSTQSSYVNAKWIIKSWTLISSLQYCAPILCKLDYGGPP